MAQIGNSLPTGFIGPADRVRRFVVCEQNSLQALWRWHQWCARSVHEAIRSCIQFTGFTASPASLRGMSFVQCIASDGLAGSEIDSGSCRSRRDDAEVKGLTR